MPDKRNVLVRFKDWLAHSRTLTSPARGSEVELAPADGIWLSQTGIIRSCTEHKESYRAS